jgi:hypothetical protein
MATQLITLPDFLVNIDRAGHVVIDLVEGVNATRSIDFGIVGDVPDAFLAWLDQSPADREVWVPVLNTYVLAEFAKRS